jgi:hypothetical protein
VTLKVISEKYLGDESARLRFLREARAAAKIRHPNVASVFHLGRTGDNYFYAMEFVEGETLDNLIRRSGPLDTSSADEFLNVALAWFGDPDPLIGTAWEKGERLARLIAHRRAWTAWSRSNIHPVHGRDGYATLPSRHFCVSSPPSMRGFA